MAREHVVKEIDGEQYTFYQLKAKVSLKLLVKLFKVLGAPMGAMAGNGAKLSDVLDQEVDLGKIVGTLCERLDEDVVEEIVDTLLSQALHAGHGEVSKAFETLFAGNMPHLFKVVLAAMEVEYGSFFGGGSVLEKLAKKVPTT